PGPPPARPASPARLIAPVGSLVVALALRVVVPPRVVLPLEVALAGGLHRPLGLRRAGVRTEAVLAGAVGALLDLHVFQAVVPLARFSGGPLLEQGHDRLLSPRKMVPRRG